MDETKLTLDNHKFIEETRWSYLEPKLTPTLKLRHGDTYRLLKLLSSKLSLKLKDKAQGKRSYRRGEAR